MSNQDFVINIPFTKVDEVRRTVTGIATADNMDLEGDIIEFAASLDAFNNWVGNIREMHAPIAVGKALDFRHTTVTGDDGRMYNGIEVEAYISRGAEDTWLKVLDKTLGGFSIGGKILDIEEEFDNTLGHIVRRITEMMLLELSLVDNPANPLAMLSMIKSVGGGNFEVQPGFKGETHQIFYCKQDDVAKTGNSTCSRCDNEMVLLGESDHFDVDEMTKMISEFKQKNGGVHNLTKEQNDDKVVAMDTEITDEQKDNILQRMGNALFGKSDEGGELVASNATAPAVNISFGNETANGFTTWTTDGTSTTDTIFRTTDIPTITTNVEITEEVVEDVEVEDTDVEKSNDKKEDDEEMDMDKFMEGISTLLDEKMTAFKQEVTEQIDEKVDEVSKSVTSVTEKIDEQESSLLEVTGKVDEVAKSGAVKKSDDVVDEDELDEEIAKSLEAEESESFWGGIFVPQVVAKSLGYNS